MMFVPSWCSMISILRGGAVQIDELKEEEEDFILTVKNN